MELRTRTIDGLSIRHAVSPGASAPSVVVLNAWPSTLEGHRPLWSRLAPDFDLLALELPGFGRSSPRADLASPRGLASFLPRILDDFGCGEVHLVAPDVSLPAALALAQQAPGRVRSLILSNGPASYPPRCPPELLALMRWAAARRLTALTPGLFLRVARARGYATGEPDAEAWQEAFEVYDREGLGRSFDYLASYPRELPVIEAGLATLQARTLVLWGARDPFFELENARRLAAALPNATLKVLADAGHFAHEDDPDAFAGAVRAWVGGRSCDEGAQRPRA